MAARRRAGSFSPKTSRRLRISKVDMLNGTAVEGGDPARERVDEAAQFGVWKCPVDVSVSFRGVAVEIVRAENDFERPTATDQMWEAFRTAAAGMQSHPDFGLAESRVLA